MGHGGDVLLLTGTSLDRLLGPRCQSLASGLPRWGRIASEADGFEVRVCSPDAPDLHPIDVPDVQPSQDVVSVVSVDDTDVSLKRSVAPVQLDRDTSSRHIVGVKTLQLTGSLTQATLACTPPRRRTKPVFCAHGGLLLEPTPE